MQSTIVKIALSFRLPFECSNNTTGESVWARESSGVLKDEEDSKESNHNEHDKEPVSAIDGASRSGTSSTSASSTSSSGELAKAKHNSTVLCRLVQGECPRLIPHLMQNAKRTRRRCNYYHSKPHKQASSVNMADLFVTSLPWGWW